MEKINAIDSLELKTAKASLLQTKANIFGQKGNLDTDLVFQQKSLEIYRELGNKKGIASSLNNIAGIYSQKGLVNDALEYYKKALSISKEFEDYLANSDLLT